MTYDAPELPKGYYFEVSESAHANYVDVEVWKKNPFFFDILVLSRDTNVNSHDPAREVKETMMVLVDDLDFSLRQREINKADKVRREKTIKSVVGKYPPRKRIG